MQVEGVSSRPFNPVASALIAGATFVARGNAGDVEQTKELIKRAMEHKGYALVDIFQPCVSFNSLNTYKWFSENTYWLENHDEGDFEKALSLVMAEAPFPLGVLYREEGRPTFAETLLAYRENKEPLFRRKASRNAVRKIMEGMCS